VLLNVPVFMGSSSEPAQANSHCHTVSLIIRVNIYYAWFSHVIFP